MIPKVIHYCWFGGNPLPELAQKCIKSWKKYCPDYEIIEWNESNFDINSNQYVKEAYEAKKWAFVTDYVRLYVLKKYGGIYMDTDVEVIKPLDTLLSNKAFSGFEDNEHIPTGIMASEKDFWLFDLLLSYYKDKHFVNEDGTIDMTTNVATITSMLKARGFIPNGMFQNIDGFALYPSEYFCPKEFYTDKIKKTKNTICIHHFNSSWLDEKGKKFKKNRKKAMLKAERHQKVKDFLLKLLGDKVYNRLRIIFRKIHK